MEQAKHKNELRTWLVAQNEYTQDVLDRIPGLPALRTRVRALSVGHDEQYNIQIRPGRRFSMIRTAGDAIAKLHVQDGEAPPRLLIDPATEPGATPALNNYSASPDGSLVAYNISTGGSEITELRVVDVASGKRLPDTIDRIWGEFPAGWLPDSSGFFYTQMSAERLADPNGDALQGMVARVHVLGANADADRPLLGPGIAGSLPMTAKEFPVVRIARGTSWAIAIMTGARSESRLAIAPASALAQDPVPWRKIADYEDVVVDVAIRGDELFLLLQSEDALNGAVLRLDATAPDLSRATTFVAAGPRVIQGIYPAEDALYLAELVDGAGAMRRVTYDGTENVLPVPAGRSVFVAHSHPGEAGVWVGMTGYTEPLTYYRMAPDGGLSPTGIANPRVVDMSGIDIERTTAISSDGEGVPMTIVRRAGLARDGKRPTLLAGYGGYGMTYLPHYAPGILAWLERDAMYAICHVRGGGAKGRAWHLAGMGKNKPQGIRDFVACAQHLRDSGYTSPAHIGATGGSMGGVLISRAITESPSAFGAAVLRVPIVNTVRYLEAQNGPNQMAELGGATPDTPEGLRTLVAMDGYHNIKPGVQYPATMVIIGLNDQRVSPWMSAKFPARLQASDTRRPVLVRALADQGHGVGSTELQKADSLADQWAFLLSELGHPDFVPEPRR